MTNWRDRKIETRRMPAGELIEHPLNPKTHPKSQLDPLVGLLNQVGRVDDLKAYYSERNGGKLTVWDGHGRRLLNPEQEWDVDIYDLSDAEADLLVIAFDPIAALVEREKDKLDALLREVSAEDAALAQMLSDIAAEEGIILPDFEPVGIEDQGRLDEKKKATCPDCGCLFQPK